eukprot:s2379_g2.t1
MVYSVQIAMRLPNQHGGVQKIRQRSMQGSCYRSSQRYSKTFKRKGASSASSASSASRRWTIFVEGSRKVRPRLTCSACVHRRHWRGPLSRCRLSVKSFRATPFPFLLKSRSFVGKVRRLQRLCAKT